MVRKSVDPPDMVPSFRFPKPFGEVPYKYPLPHPPLFAKPHQLQPSIHSLKLSSSSSPAFFFPQTSKAMNTLHDYRAFQKQGILTILPSSDVPSPTLNPAPSLRRTLSADMSSTKCFSALKKTASSQAFSLSASAIHSYSSSSSEGEEEEDYDDFKDASFGFWDSVQEYQKKQKMKIECHKQGDVDSWSSILSQNSASDVPKSPLLPYVHPLVKKSTSTLSEKSLQICTESLGSETGSDEISSYPSSNAGDFDGDTAKTEDPQSDTFQGRPITFGRRKSPPRSFPPSISSLTSPDGASICIRSRRENGRLILDAVSVPSQKNFRADRRDGRLILSFVTTPAKLIEQAVQEEEDELEEFVARDFEEVKESEIAEERDDENDFEKADELEIPMEKAPRLSRSDINFHRLAMMMKKPDGLINRNPAWPKEIDALEPPTPLSQSLPLRPPSLAGATAAASLNAYEYYWRSKPTGKSAGIQNPNGQQQTKPIKSVTGKLISSNNQMANEKQQILVLKGNRGDYLVPLSNACKVPRRSLLLREPCCIATT